MRYRDAGVDIDAASQAKARIKQLARSTFSPRVLREVGAFGGFFSLQGLPRDAVLVSSVDGVGTKLKVAFALNRHNTVGADLVNHCVNDIAVHGAAPLFFLDYLATGKMHPKVVTEVVRGLAGACRKVGCALVGGETAEMPGFYPEDEYDLAGCIVGWVKRGQIVDGSGIRPGDAILGLPSLGLHTNGYSLARKVLLEQENLPLTEPIPELGRTLGDVLLAPHRCYWPTVQPLLARGWLKGLVHITGGGITDNTPRMLPSGLAITSFTGTGAGTTGTVASTTSTSATTLAGTAPSGSIGSLEVGVSGTFPNSAHFDPVAEWIDGLSASPMFSPPGVASVTNSAVGGNTAVSFQSNLWLTPQANLDKNVG